jgi:YegS/Rv2252/BmrU family lipid kinase
MRRVKVIFNPKANRGHNGSIAAILRQYTQETQRSGYTDWAQTDRAGHAAELALAAAQQGYGCVVAVGGDGTVHEVINGLMQCEAAQRPALGIVPIGSGNDLVRGAAMTAEPIRALEHAFGDDHLQAMDVGYIRLASQPTVYWANVVGIGFDAAVTRQSQRMRRIRGQAMYFIAAVRTIIENYDAPALSLRIDDMALSQHVQMLTVGNGTREGGGFVTTPSARINDGRLDYALFSPVSRAMMVRLIPEVMRGTHGRFSVVRMGTFKTMQLEADRPLLVHSDGEMLTEVADNVRTLEIGVMPSALRLVS